MNLLNQMGHHAALQMQCPLKIKKNSTQALFKARRIKQQILLVVDLKFHIRAKRCMEKNLKHRS
jgi:hypothetical protein